MATEMSEQVAQHLDAGEFSQAVESIMAAWNERDEFGTRHCPLPGYTDRWVKFKTRGYPFSLRKRWDDAKTDTAIFGLILPYVVDWNLVDVDGQSVPVPTNSVDYLADIGNIEDAVLMWLVREFNLFWFSELLAPRKNS